MGHPQGHEYGAAVCLPSPFFLTESAQSVSKFWKKAEGEEERNSTEEIAEQNDDGGDENIENGNAHDDDAG